MRWARVVLATAVLSAVAAAASPASAFAAAGFYGSYDTSDLASLREASQECVACHVQTQLGSRIVYCGILETYESASDDSHSSALTPCLACHVDHDEAGMGGAVASKRLRIRAYQREFVDDIAGGDAAAITQGSVLSPGWDARDIQITAFCSTCHPVYSNDTDQRVIVEETGEDGMPAEVGYSNHPLRPATPDGGAEGGRMSAVSSTGCRSCHAAGDTDGGSATLASFPHSTPGYPLFLVSAADADSEPEAPESPLQDGVCLRCHRWKDAGATTRGVGVDW